MELDYFISLSSRASSSVKDKWLDSSSLATRSFSAKSSYSFTGISGNSDFSLFFTFGRSGSGAGAILSNYNLGGGLGFGIGFNDNNQLFAYSYDPTIEVNDYTKINLSTKNCIGIIKSDSRISILNYDLNAKDIYQTDSFSFPTESVVYGSGFKLGYSLPFYSKTNVTGISGIFDQMVLFNSALDTSDCLTIFSGFLPLTKSQTTTYGFKYFEEDAFEIKNGSVLTQTQAEKFIPFLNYISTGVIPISTGNYTATISGLVRYNLFEILWSGFYASGNQQNCAITGNRTTATGTYSSFTPPTNDNIVFTDQIYVSMNGQSERSVSHLVSFTTYTYPNVDDYFSYNIISKYKTQTVVSLTENSNSYKSGFYMNGVVIDKAYCSLLTYRDKTYKDVGISLPFDTAKQRFLATDEIILGYNLYWGEDRIYNYDISGLYIETPAVEEDKTYEMIFDKSNYDPSYVHTNFTFATGKFPKGGAIVLAGNSVYRKSFRENNKNFRETCIYDMLNGKRNKAISVEYSEILANSDNNWSGSMMPLVTSM